MCFKTKMDNLFTVQEIILNVLIHCDINTIIRLYRTNKQYLQICNIAYFWQELYNVYKLPYNIKNCKKRRKFNINIEEFIHSYNANMLAVYLASLPSIKFDFTFHYGGTEEVLDVLKKLNVQCNVKSNLPTLKSVSDYNPVVSIINGNITLKINYDFDIYYKNIAVLEHDQLVSFLYELIITNNFSYRSRYGFNKCNIKEYKERLKLPFYQCKK